MMRAAKLQEPTIFDTLRAEAVPAKLVPYKGPCSRGR
jgi:hypothetical protein